VAEHLTGFALAQAQCAALTGTRWFNHFISAVIVAAGVFVGIDTYNFARVRYTTHLELVDKAIIVIFIAELVLRFVGEGAQPRKFLRSGWNLFDTFLVVMSLVPVAAAFTSAVRLIRLLRVIRLLRNMPKLHLLVKTAANSVPSIVSISVLLGLLFYVYAVAGVVFFAANDPVHFPNLETSLLSLFRVVTLEDWTDIMYIQIYGCENYGYSGIEERCVDSKEFGAFGALYFTTFVFIGTWVVLNLFIGIILTGMDEARREVESAEASGSGAVPKTPKPKPLPSAGATAAPVTTGELAALQEDLARLQDRITSIQNVGASANGSGLDGPVNEDANGSNGQGPSGSSRRTDLLSPLALSSHDDSA